MGEIILQHTGTNSGGGGGPMLSKHSKWGCLSNISRRPHLGKISGDNMSFKQQQITEMTTQILLLNTHRDMASSSIHEVVFKIQYFK